ncbi:hypothetical protein BBD26_0941 [Lactobacillus delbrueckii subsp. bulgaricus]|nr:hypothetical protein BBD26_0941 [Lactobacillus delbrueckii subsp. bulgaricus]
MAFILFSKINRNFTEKYSPEVSYFFTIKKGKIAKNFYPEKASL